MFDSSFMWLVVFVVVLLMLLIHTSQLNRRVEQAEDYLHECVTKDQLREYVMATIKAAVHE